MQAHHHALIGAVAGVLPDLALALFGWRRDWLPEKHPLVKAHRFLHSGYGVIVPLSLGWLSHVIVDRYSFHNSPPDERNSG